MHPALRKGPLFYKKTPPPNLHLFYKKTLAPAILFPAHWPASTRRVVRYLSLNRCVPSIGVNATGDAGDTPPSNIWSAGDEVSYIPGKVCQVSAAVGC